MKDQKGFAVVETVLILIIVTLIAVVGVYVWHARQSTNEVLSDANKSTVTSSQSHKSKSASATPSQSQNYVTFSQWGVRAPYDGNLALTYELRNNTIAAFTSKELLALDSSCTGDYGGFIIRYLPTSDASEGGDDNFTAADRAKEDDAQGMHDYAFVNGYYYFYQSPQSACPDATDFSDTSPEIKLQKQTQTDIKSLVPKLQAY